MATVEIMSISLEEDEAIQFAAKAAALSYAMKNGKAEEMEAMFISALNALINDQLMNKEKDSFKVFNKNILDLALLNAASFNKNIVDLAEEAEKRINKQTKH